MRLAPLVVLLVLAGCADPPSAAPPTGFLTHATDCRLATNATTCHASTERSPLVVATEGRGNRSKVGVVLRNTDDAPLTFDAHPPAFWLYAKHDGGWWHPVAFDEGGALPGRPVEPGGNASLVLNYGRFEAGARSRDVRYDEPVESFPWPSGTYRACWSAHPEGVTEWVRGCKDFRIR